MPGAADDMVGDVMIKRIDEESRLSINIGVDDDVYARQGMRYRP